MVEYPSLSPSRSVPVATPSKQTQRRVSEQIWSPDAGIVFAKPPKPVDTATLTCTVSDSSAVPRNASPSSTPPVNTSLRAWEGTSRGPPEQKAEPTPTSPISRIRSNDQLRVSKRYRHQLLLPRRRYTNRADVPEDTSSARKSQPPSAQKPFLKPAKTSKGNSTIEPVRNFLESLTLFLHHWMRVLLGLPALSLSFAGSGTVASVWSSIFRTRPERPEQPTSIYWTYKTDAPKTGVTPAVKLCTDKATSDKLAAQFLNEAIVGFDLEWDSFATSSSGPKRNVSLIQVAKKDLIALFQVARFPDADNADLLPANLRTLIENATILKTGVNIAGDCTRLRNFFKVEPKGIFELSHAYRLVKYHDGPIESIREINKKLVSLATQAEEHLGLPLFKEQHVRASNWTKPLSAEQTLYAASDAYSCLRLFHILDEKRQALDPAPPRPAAHELGKPIRLGSGQTVAEYLAKHDGAAKQKVVIDDDDDLESDSASFTSSNVTSDADLTSSDDKDPLPSSGSLSAEDQQLLFAASVYAETYHATVAGTSGIKKPLKRQLQAYFLWHSRTQSPKDAARLFQVKPSTIACYALEAIFIARLDYEPARAQEELVPLIPPLVREKRFWMFKGVPGQDRQNKSKNGEGLEVEKIE